MAANYRSAGLARSHAEFTAKLGVVREEADESLYWLVYLRDAELPDPSALEPLVNEAFELFKILDRSFKPASPRHTRRPFPTDTH